MNQTPPNTVGEALIIEFVFQPLNGIRQIFVPFPN